MSDSDEHPQSAAKAQLESMKSRLVASDLIDKPELDSHRWLVDSAIISSNGAPNKIAAMAETQARLVAFIVQQSQREPARLAEAFAHAHVCMFKTNAAGEFIDPPWKPAIEEAIVTAFREHGQAHATPVAPTESAPDSCIELKLPLIGTVMVSRGRAAAVLAGSIGKAAIFLIVVGGLLYWQSSRFADLVDRRFEAASRERACNDARSATRAADLQETLDNQ